jgi:hypothetical protein
MTKNKFKHTVELLAKAILERYRMQVSANEESNVALVLKIPNLKKSLMRKMKALKMCDAYNETNKNPNLDDTLVNKLFEAAASAGFLDELLASDTDQFEAGALSFEGYGGDIWAALNAAKRKHDHEVEASHLAADDHEREHDQEHDHDGHNNTRRQLRL